MVLPNVVFPHPDSPTKPSVSPGYTLKLISLTAFTKLVGFPNIFLLIGKYVFKFLISSIGVFEYNFCCNSFLSSLRITLLTLSFKETIFSEITPFAFSIIKSAMIGNVLYLFFMLGRQAINPFV